MQAPYDCDYLIIGSGFGGSVSACRLAEKGYDVAVMEMGRRWSAQNLPESNWDLRRWVWRPGLKLFGFFNLRIFRHVMVICGNAVGGGSITYANTLLVPPDSVWREGSWAGAADWQAEMPQHFATAERMLGVVDNTWLGPADHRLREMAHAAGLGHTFRPTRVATCFATDGQSPGQAVGDPYFGGEGPLRSTCTGCGGCMMGCKHNAKNSLDKNYLWFAEKHGAKVHAETRVIDVQPLDAEGDGREGYLVTTERSTAWWRRERRTWRARHVVFSGSSLGTQELLLRLKARGSLPRLSDALGHGVRTNAESLIGVRFADGSADMSEGVAIGSSIHLDAYTHIEATRYPKGSDAMGLISTLMPEGGGRWARVGRWLALALRHPRTFLRMANPRGFAQQTLILLVMQTLDGCLRMRLRRPWYWPFARVLSSEGEPIPTYIPAANDFARRLAQHFGGVPMTGLGEILFNVPLTAHCMGGCAIAHEPAHGVVDPQHRVFHYRNLLVVDGSTLGANLGVNPSLTITALAERAMSFIPPKQAPQDAQR